MYPAQQGNGTQAGGAYGWAAGWPLLILPQIEQQPLFNAYNFCFSIYDPSTSGSATINSTVAYVQLGMLLCPSDGVTKPTNAPWGTTDYVGNVGGPGTFAVWTGTIVPNGWYSHPNIGPFGAESIRDGTSNTALWSERLHGLPGNPTIARSSPDFKRTSFASPVTIPTPILASDPTGTQTQALGYLQACNSIPGSTATANGVYIGYVWTLGYPWNLIISSYSHFGTPNSVNCNNAGESHGVDSYFGGPGSSMPPSSNHSGGVNICFADGSVKFIKDSVNTLTWWALGTRNGGEVVSSDAY
jgi:prepilin-type processing-associated H-X9-DG protein